MLQFIGKRLEKVTIQQKCLQVVHLAYNCWNISEGIAGHVELRQGWDTANCQWEVS